MLTVTIVLIVTFIIVTALIEGNTEEVHPYWAGIILLAPIIALESFYFKGMTQNIWFYILEHTFLVVGYITLYVFSGILWSLYKWKVYLKNEVEKFKERKDYYALKFLKPSYKKELIISWLIYWPFSFGWFIIHKPITKIYKGLYDKISGVYNSMYKSIAESEYDNQKRDFDNS